ncbi:MAG: ATP-binding protein [Bacteroidota bacterium]|nr:ATP-binding protein [Bacteroidota bacterium]
MKEIVIISGKGGTGKTSFTASLAYLGGNDVVVADCDVDAADMHLLLEPDFAKSEDFYSGELAVINQDKCTKCGICKDVCRFDAIPIINNEYIVDPLSCEGCGYCARVCPVNAITNKDLNVGDWYISNTKVNNTLVHAKLAIGADNSGKLVAKVKNEAKRIAKENNKDYIIVDGSPGVGCPVVSSLSGANFVVLVTEPSVSGLHDLKRVYELVKKFNLKAGCIINKADINKDKTNEIREFLKKENIEYIADFPYDVNFTNAMTKGQTIVEYDNGDLKNIVVDSWNKIKEYTK